jgi:hypothetical protein
MVMKKSPGGSIFPYYYKNGELFGAHFGSFFNDEEGLLARMKAEEAFFLAENKPLPYWVDFYESRLTDKVLIEFCQSISHMQKIVTRLAIVGCSFRDKLRLRRLASKNGLEFTMPVRFFSDPEAAKSWLIGESNA